MPEGIFPYCTKDIVRFRKVPEARGRWLEFPKHSGCWEASRQHCCRAAFQISKRYLAGSIRRLTQVPDITKHSDVVLFVRSSWASYQIHKISGCACAGNAGNVFPRPRLQRKPLVSDPVTHVPWCMSGSLTRGGWENVPGIPGACAPAILRIWQEAHGG